MENHWRWRLRMANQLAAELDPRQYGVVALYLLGSTKNATAGEGSDVDLLVRFRGTVQQEKELRSWLGIWRRRLAEMNYERTGHRLDGLLDVHWIIDSDIKRRTSYAVRIGASTEPAMPLPMKARGLKN
jgi:predicted nucleotidyltransferase